VRPTENASSIDPRVAVLPKSGFVYSRGLLAAVLR
jgi:hypothetical protein